MPTLKNSISPLHLRHRNRVEWHDWPKVTALSGIVGWDALRSLAWNVYGPTNLEGGFLGFKHTLETEDAYADAKLLNHLGGCNRRMGDCKPGRTLAASNCGIRSLFSPEFYGRCSDVAFSSSIS